MAYQPSIKSTNKSSRSEPSLKGPLYLDLITLKHNGNGKDRASEEEYFFLVEKDKRKQDIGGLLHIVGSGTPNIYLTILNNFCPMNTPQYVRRQSLGMVKGEIEFMEVVNYAPLCVTKENTNLDQAIYRRWKKDMVKQALRLGVLQT